MDVLSIAALEERTKGQRQERQATMALLGKLVTDSIHGRQLRTTLSRFIPTGLLERVLCAVSVSPAAGVVAWDGENEEPDLIWNNTCRLEIREV